MRKSTFFLFLLSVLLFSTTEVIASSGSYTHTNTPIELEPASLNNSYQTAAVCFLGTGDCGAGSFGKGDDDMGVDTGNQCKNEGYDKTCPAGWHPEVGVSCPYDPNYKKCCKETCPENAATSCTGEAVGSDGCGYTCKKCCSTSCDVRYNYTESQLTGSTGNGWVKDGEDFCDHCTRGKLYKRKAAQLPPGYQTCSCGGSNPFVSGGTTYYQSCNCCSNCSGYDDSYSSCSYGYDACRDNCTGQTRYKCNSCDDSCSGYRYTPNSATCPNGYKNKPTQCGNTCNICKPKNVVYGEEYIATRFSGSCFVSANGNICYSTCGTYNYYVDGVRKENSQICDSENKTGQSRVCFYLYDVSSITACEAKKYLQTSCHITDNEKRNDFYNGTCNF